MLIKKSCLIIIIVFFYFFCYSQNRNVEDSNGYNIFYYGNGNIASEGNMLNGNPDGLWKNYHINGKLKSVGKRRNSLLDSVWTFYDENENITKRINYLNGKKNGYLYVYHYRKNIDTTLNLMYLYSEKLYVNNLIEGKETIYFENGKIKENYKYIEGKKEGKAYEFDLDERIITVYEFSNDQIVEEDKINRYDSESHKHGIWREYYKNKKIKIEINYIHGKIEGLKKEFNNKGELIEAKRYENNIIVDENVEVEDSVNFKNEYYSLKDENGDPIPKFSGAYKKNKPIGIHRTFDEYGRVNSSKMYDKYGNLIASGIVDMDGDKQGNWKYYFESGKIRAKGKFKKNRRDGKWIFYYENNTKEQIGEYINGRYNKIWRWYYKDGSLAREENYYRGKENGDFIEFDEFGNEIVIGFYIEGNKEGEWKYNVGDHTEIGKYQNNLKEGIWNYYYLNGKLYFKGNYIQGYADGKHKYYYKNGKLKEEKVYVMGRKEKLWKKVDVYGNVIEVLYYENDELIKINGVRIINKQEEN